MRAKGTCSWKIAGAVLWLALTVQPALAGATCSYDAGTHTVTADVTPEAPVPLLIPTGTGEIKFSIPNVDCGAATVTNTDTIVLNDGTPGGSGGLFMYIIPTSVPFAPGFTPEPGSSDEIEFVVNFGPGGDALGFDGRFTGTALNARLGANQVNLNAVEADGIDADVTLNGVEEFTFMGSDFNDVVSGQGGAGTPDTPFTRDIDVQNGNLGDDVFVGGNDQDSFFGGEGNDVLLGMKGPDSLHDDAGNDVLKGGKGPDDALSGGAGDDLISGGPKQDDLGGGSGNDKMTGGPGDDELFGHAGKDRLNGGPDEDRCVGGPGKDKLKNCEINK